MENNLKFTEQYYERVRLSKGTNVLLRLVRPDDKERLQNGFRKLSSQSRYKRFFTAKQSLTNAELDYFTELDQSEHFALGAIEFNDRGEEGDGVGIARFIRLTDDATSAEVAITVIDRMQGNGIGRIMLEKLLAAAAERNVSRFRFEYLPHNRNMRKLIQSVCQVVNYTKEDGIMVAETYVTDRYPSSVKNPLDQFERAFYLLQVFTTMTLKLQFNIGLTALNRTLDVMFARDSV